MPQFIFPDANHGAGIFPYIETPNTWPSHVGKYSIPPWFVSGIEHPPKTNIFCDPKIPNPRGMSTDVPFSSGALGIALALRQRLVIHAGGLTEGDRRHALLFPAGNALLPERMTRL